MVTEQKELQSWSFHVEEVSAGVYQVIGVDTKGRRVEKKGSDPDTLLEDCKRAAAEIERAAQREAP